MTKRQQSMPKKQAKKISRSSKSENYVFGHPLFADTAVIPPQKLYSDTAYWYDEEKRERLWESNIPKAEENFYAPFKVSPYGFTQSLPDRYSEYIGEVQIQEFEFSKNAIVRTLFSEDIDGVGDDPENPGIGSLQFVSRDVVTGEFQLSNGRITGTAYTLTRQNLDDGRPVGKSTKIKAGGEIISEELIYSSRDIFQWRSEEGIQVTGPTGLSITWPYDGGWKEIEPVQVTSSDDTGYGIPVNKFFPNGWELSPFGDNLV
jgi:hypothetical protein